jgi:hypothetical protein
VGDLVGRLGRSWRRIVASLVGVVIVGLAVGFVWLGNVYQPLSEGYWVGGDTIAPGSLFVRIERDPFGDGSMWVYCDQPNGRFAWGTTFRNDGPLPVTILGGDPGPLRGVDMSDSNDFRLVDFALAPNQPPGTADPRQLPSMTPVTLASGDELPIWARFELGGLAAQSGTGESMRSLSVRYSVLGVERTAEVALRDGVGVEGAQTACPPARAN